MSMGVNSDCFITLRFMDLIEKHEQNTKEIRKNTKSCSITRTEKSFKLSRKFSVEIGFQSSDKNYPPLHPLRKGITGDNAI